YPFALVGAAAGWLSAGFLANPIVAVTVGREQVSAALCSSIIGALVGAWLTHACERERKRALLELRAPREQTESGVLRALAFELVCSVVIGGAVGGACVGGLSRHSIGGAGSGAVNGALCAIAFLPVCTLVLSAALRAQRARLGSIVAAADRRAVWGILA